MLNWDGQVSCVNALEAQVKEKDVERERDAQIRRGESAIL